MSTSRCTASNFFSATLLNWLLNFTISLDLSEPEDLGESGPFEERSAPRTKADLLREIRQRADRRTGQQEAEQRQIDPWQAQPPQRRGHGR